MLETFSDHLSFFVCILFVFLSLRLFISALFYNKDKKYLKSINIFTDYEDFED